MAAFTKTPTGQRESAAKHRGTKVHQGGSLPWSESRKKKAKEFDGCQWKLAKQRKVKNQGKRTTKLNGPTGRKKKQPAKPKR